MISFTLERPEGRGSASISSSYYSLEYSNSVLTPFYRVCLLISLFKYSEASKLASIKAGFTGSGLANVEAGSWVEFHDEFYSEKRDMITGLTDGATDYAINIRPTNGEWRILGDGE
ncbi:hypothetical protein Tco_1039605 [Tanacetum coccineum]